MVTLLKWHLESGIRLCPNVPLLMDQAEQALTEKDTMAKV